MFSEYFFSDNLKDIFFFFLFSCGLSLLLLSLSLFITLDSKLDIEKISVYECGFAPFSESRFRFHINFYLISLIFVLFDVEILYLFPLTLSFFLFSSFPMWIIFFFFLILFVGLIYEISLGILDFA